MAPLSEKTVRLYVFKAALRDYFNGSEDVKKSFLIPTKEQMQNEAFDKDLININKNARDKAFEKFFNRVTRSIIMKNDGTPYTGDNCIYKIADDFIAGKGIIFRGTDSEGFVHIKADNALIMQREFIKANEKALPQYMPHSLQESNQFNTVSVKVNCDPAGPEADERFKPENMDENKPTKGGWWNSIVKAITGHPSARWRKYENYQRHQKIVNSMLLAAEPLRGKQELTEDVVKECQKAAVDDYNMENAKKKIELNMKEFESSFDTIKNQFRYDEESGTYKKLSTEAIEKKVQEREKEKAEKQIQLDRENAEKNIEENKTEKKVEVQPEVKKPEIKESTRRYSALLDIKKSKGMNKIMESKAIMAEDRFDTAMKGLIYYNQPDAPANLPPMTEDLMAQYLTTIYMVGEMIQSAEEGYSKYGEPEDTEETFGALADEILGKSKSKPITEAVNNFIKTKGLAKEYMENPAALEDTFFKGNGLQNLKKFVNDIQISGKTDQIIEDVCTKNTNAHIAAEKDKTAYSVKGL